VLNFLPNKLKNAILKLGIDKLSEIRIRNGRPVEILLNGDKLFLEKYGMTPRQFIIDIRINKAKQLLGEGKLKVSEVATQCGFSSSYHFCRTFRDHVGVTPSYYAQNNRISEM
jgi:stage III sporulation protein SpoIIIAA